MPDVPPEPTEAPAGGCLLAGLYVGAFLAWYVGVVALLGATGGQRLLSSSVGLSLLVALVGLGGVAIGEAVRRGSGWSPAEAWGLDGARPRPRLWWGAALGGLCLGVLGGWLGEQVGEPLRELLRWPEGADALAVLGGALTEGPIGGRVLFAAVVIGLGPVAEELVFRGMLWRIVRPLGASIAILSTALLFAAYHGDPVQAVGVLPLALFLGVVRASGGGLLVCVLVHVINNALATLYVLAGTADGATPLPWVVAAASLSLVAVMLVTRGHGQRGAERPLR